MKRRAAETVYSRLMDVREEYDEMYQALQRMLSWAAAAERGQADKVDWAGVRAEILALRAFKDGGGG